MEFVGLDCKAQIFQHKTFECCRFVDSQFNHARFTQCKFVDCDFQACDLSTAEFDKSVLVDVVFSDSKLTGIDWNKLNWPTVVIHPPFALYQSDLSYSSFYGLNMEHIIIQACKAYDVDFRGANLTHADLTLTDFEKAQFVQTKLYAADFTEALHYCIDPNENDIRKAIFSMPDVLGLLQHFDIQIKT